MSSVAILSEILDSRKGGKNAGFNGFLEDYLNSDAPIKDEVRESLQKVLEAYPDFKILTDFRFNVNKDAISNQIIRYKDVTKLPNNYYDLALILYGALENQELCILVADGTRNVDYFLAKGMYYTLTEQYGLLEDARQEVIVLTMAHLDELTDIINQFNNDPRLRVAPFQRRVDKKYFNNFEELKEQVYEIAHNIKDNVGDDLGIVKDRSVIIFRNIASWFLFKKLLYVSYMSNKDFLNNKAQGNMRHHRNNAKQVVDGIPFIAFSEMWRMKNTKPKAASNEQEAPVVDEKAVVDEKPVQQETVVTPEELNDPVMATPDVDTDPEEQVESASVHDIPMSTPDVDSDETLEDIEPVEVQPQEEVETETPQEPVEGEPEEEMSEESTFEKEPATEEEPVEVVEESEEEPTPEEEPVEVVEETEEPTEEVEVPEELDDPVMATPDVDADPEEAEQEATMHDIPMSTPDNNRDYTQDETPIEAPTENPEEPVVEREAPSHQEQEGEIKL